MAAATCAGRDGTPINGRAEDVAGQRNAGRPAEVQDVGNGAAAMSARSLTQEGTCLARIAKTSGAASSSRNSSGPNAARRRALSRSWIGSTPPESAASPNRPVIAFRGLGHRLQPGVDSARRDPARPRLAAVPTASNVTITRESGPGTESGHRTSPTVTPESGLPAKGAECLQFDSRSLAVVGRVIGLSVRAMPRSTAGPSRHRTGFTAGRTKPTGVYSGASWVGRMLARTARLAGEERLLQIGLASLALWNERARLIPGRLPSEW